MTLCGWRDVKIQERTKFFGLFFFLSTHNNHYLNWHFLDNFHSRPWYMAHTSPSYLLPAQCWVFTKKRYSCRSGAARNFKDDEPMFVARSGFWKMLACFEAHLTAEWLSHRVAQFTSTADLRACMICLFNIFTGCGAFFELFELHSESDLNVDVCFMTEGTAQPFIFLCWIV